ncbi:MAG: site-specific integrase [Pseudomonas sp.]|nr:site-specific integrase [Pseudomonas sp.]
MGHQIIEIRINGARRKVLVQELTPAYYPNLYVTLEHSRRALNTQHKYLEHIGLFEDFLKFESIDLVARLEERPNSHYLTDDEISRFVADAVLNKSTLAKKFSGVRILPAAYSTVGSTHAQQRLEAVRDYTKFLYDKLGEETTRGAAIDDIVNRLNRKIKAAKPAWRKTSNNDIKGLSSAERDRLVEIFHPESATNPFANKAIKLRNYIILLLGLDMGLRRSEMLLIKVEDIRWHSRELSVTNLENEKIDPRTLAPQFKTHERVLEMGDDLAWAIKQYVDSYRISIQETSEAKKHPFLLVSHRRNEGKPLSVKALDGILPRIGKVVPALAHVHPHVLRHDAVYTLLESMRNELDILSPEDRATKVQKVLTYAFGWSHDSHMPSLYGAKFWREEANKAMKKRSDRFKLIRDNVGTKKREEGLQIEPDNFSN